MKYETVKNVPVKYAIIGANGRVGKMLCDVLGDNIIAIGRNDSLDAADRADVLIDFSVAEAVATTLNWAAAHHKPLVCGVTGLDTITRQAMQQTAKHIPILYAANMSLSVALLAKLAAQAQQILGDDFTASIVETHHRFKKDAPSGTALMLANAIGGNVPIASQRGGDVVGTHQIHFLGDGENLSLTHTATNRAIFAKGSIRAANWLLGQPPGLYGIENLLD